MNTKIIEKAILGYMILDNSLDSELLKAKYFFYDKNRLVYETIENLKKSEEKTISIEILATELDGKVEAAYISSLLDGLHGLRTGLLEFHFKNDANKLIQVNKEQETKRLVSKIIKEPDFIPQLKEILESYELEAIEPIEKFTLTHHADKFKEFIEKKRRGEFWGLEIKCFPRLTSALMGLREIIVLAAEPKVGKSTLALQIASDIADQGAGVLYYDFENGRMNLMARELSRKHNITYTELLGHGSSNAEQIETALKHLQEQYKNFAIITGSRLTIEKITGHVFQMRQLTKQENILIVIDSLQRLPMKDLKDRRAAVDTWLRDFEKIKREDPSLTILMVSELSRAGKPKESGDIEYTGHFLLKLKKNQTVEEIGKFGESGERRLYLEYARDVRAGLTIKYRADFSYWKFIEEEERF